MHRPLSILIACTALAVAQPASKPLLIEHVRVFDGTRVIANSSVLVENGIIRMVGASIVAPPERTQSMAPARRAPPGPETGR